MRVHRQALLSFTLAVMLALGQSAGAWAASIASQGRPHGSTATVVIAKSNASDKIKVVGTSTITVMSGTTVQQLKAQIDAKDHSKQTHTVVDPNGNEKTQEAIGIGDKLVVTAEDARNRYTYSLAVFDPTAKERDGVYWNEDLYNEIDGTVNANTPVFRDYYCDITDPKYAASIRQATESFYIGNVANNPANKTSPLVASSQVVWYYTDAIAAAMKDCNEAGGGIVLVPAGGALNANGAYYSGAITLLSKSTSSSRRAPRSSLCATRPTSSIRLC